MQGNLERLCLGSQQIPALNSQCYHVMWEIGGESEEIKILTAE